MECLKVGRREASLASLYLQPLVKTSSGMAALRCSDRELSPHASLTSLFYIFNKPCLGKW